jgi:lincosamide nucleotidyltransferase A/C/D/E
VRSADVVSVVTAMNDGDVDVCVEGGWGVDALVRRETRRHTDLDIFVAATAISAQPQCLQDEAFTIWLGCRRQVCTATTPTAA